MAKKTKRDEEVKEIEQSAEIEAQEEVVVIEDTTHLRAELIRSFFPVVADALGGELDASNPDHLIIAAFTVGRRGHLRR